MGVPWGHQTQSVTKVTATMSLLSIIAELIIYRKGIKILNMNDSNEYMYVCITHTFPISRQLVFIINTVTIIIFIKELLYPFPQVGEGPDHYS